MIMIKRYWYFYVLFLAALAYMIWACVSGDDERIIRSVFFFLSMLIVFVTTIIRDKTIRKKDIKLPSVVIRRMVVLFICSIVAIVTGYFAGYLLIGCIVSFVLGCFALKSVMCSYRSNSSK